MFEALSILYNNIFEKERFINKTIILARKNTLNTTVENILKDNNLSFEKNNFNKDLLKYNDIGNGHISLERKSVKSEAEIQLAKKLKVINHQDNSIEEVEKLIKIINYNENLSNQKKIKKKKSNSIPIKTVELIRKSSSFLKSPSQMMNDFKNNYQRLSIEDALERVNLDENDNDELIYNEKAENEKKFIAKIKKRGDRILERLRKSKYDKLNLLQILDKSSKDFKKDYVPVNLHSESNYKNVRLYQKKVTILPNSNVNSRTETPDKHLFTHDDTRKSTNPKSSLYFIRNTTQNNMNLKALQQPNPLIKVSLYKSRNDQISSTKTKSTKKSYNPDFSNILTTTVNQCFQNKSTNHNRDKSSPLEITKVAKLINPQSSNLTRNVYKNSLPFLISQNTQKSKRKIKYSMDSKIF